MNSMNSNNKRSRECDEDEPQDKRLRESESDTEYWFVNGLAVNEESRELFSSSEIEERALLAKQWFSKMAIAQLNGKLESKQSRKRSRTL
jgi:hypothetical protein